jgi:excisionase family DNA binding protein
LKKPTNRVELSSSQCGKLKQNDPKQASKAARPTDEVFTVAEVASILKLNQQTVRNWIDTGALPALRIGRRVRIKRAVLEDIIEHGLQIEDEEGSQHPEMAAETSSPAQGSSDAP